MQFEGEDEIAEWFRRLPLECVDRRATDAELADFEAQFRPIPPVFRWFLLECGGGPVGPDWVDGIDKLSQTHRKFERERQSGRGWTLTNVFVIGWDGAGNPFGIKEDSGAVVVEDHNFGGVHELAPSFADFLRARLG